MSRNLKLLSPFKLGSLKLPNRMLLAPMTRCRAGVGNIIEQISTVYYGQRASAGLIITEATQISPQGAGYPNVPGIHTLQQVNSWKQVTKAVHAKGGHIFLQLWHAGRASHPLLQPDRELPIGPSAIKAEGTVVTPEGEKPFPTPRALKMEEIPEIVEQFRQGAKNALTAEFDGVEIHSANGYLLDQFLQDNSNQRTDKYGGSVENRARLLLQVTEAVVSVWGPNRVGVRLSPSSTYKDMHDSNPINTFGYVVDALNRFDLAYLHIIEPRIKGNETTDDEGQGLGVRYFRPIFKGSLIAAGGYTRETGEAILAEGLADLVAYGRLFLANPDLPKRFALNTPLNKYDRSTFYTSGERGYIDYPTLEELQQNQLPLVGKYVMRQPQVESIKTNQLF
ncbi:alkene reductase [Scytonema sp. NUACC21]